ncbi:hypothetical protein B0H63DRAFT_502881 [Podospora didyma]|uniref:NAD(P)-binding protein n=1 Tax=Podospora didyma TaxID=330526 RepID=A0AAE0KDY1_9PEZI|nr:hypothetical protein B0H63DRAFT_502881 [Podospora didyma]
MSTAFDITPERRASQLHFYYRQLFVTPPPVSPHDADLGGKTAVVTGSNGGLGLETARQLLDLGANVILAVRDEEKGKLARLDLAKGRDLSPESIQVWKLDLSSYESIIAFAERAKDLEHLDIAILNAGVFKVEEAFNSVTGFEESMQINYLSTMLLTILLLSIIKDKKIGSGPGHICIVGSEAAAWAKFEQRTSNPLLPAFKQKSAKWEIGEAYKTSKLLGQLFLTELVKHVSASVVTISNVSPGFCAGSEIGREITGLIALLFKIQYILLARTSAVGARSMVHAVTTLADKAHGQYIEDAKIQPMAVVVYKPEGLRLAKQLYEETLDELSFVGIRDIIEEISKLK